METPDAVRELRAELNAAYASHHKIANQAQKLIGQVEELKVENVLLRTAAEEWKRLAELACENPPENCDCPGCKAAAVYYGEDEENR